MWASILDEIYEIGTNKKKNVAPESVPESNTYTWML